MEWTIRKAAASDVDALGALYDDVCDELEGKPHNPGWRKGAFPTREDARWLLQRGAVLLAHAGGELAGTLAVNADPGAEEGAAIADDGANALYIHIFAVHPAQRRRGVGARLLDAACEYAAQAGAQALRLYVWERNDAAIAAYESSGFACIGRHDIGLGEYVPGLFCLYEKAIAPRS